MSKKKKKHHKVMANDRKAKIKNHPYLSKKVADGLIYMYEREPEWAEEVEALIDKTVNHMKKNDVCNGYIITKIDMFFPIRCGDILSEYDHVELLDEIYDNFYKDYIASKEEDVVQLDYIKCIFSKKEQDSPNEQRVAYYVEYKTGKYGGNTTSYDFFCWDDNVRK